MTDDKFNQIWEKVIVRQANKLLKEAQSNDLKFDESKKESIRKRYDEINEALHKPMKNPDGKIDRHKVAAALAAAIILEAPFDSPLLYGSDATESRIGDPQFVRADFLPNEFLAIIVSIFVVLDFLLEIGNTRTKKQFQKGVYYPRCEHGKYIQHLSSAFHMAFRKESFDPFMYSHVLFLLEKYTELYKTSKM